MDRIARIDASGRRAHLQLRHVVAEAWRTLRARPGLFVGAGLLIFIPLGLVDVIDDHIQEPLSEVDDDVTSGDIWIVLVAAIGHSIVALFGDVLYTGIVARAVVSVRLGDHRSLWEIVRTLPYLRGSPSADVLRPSSWASTSWPGSSRA